MDGHGTGTSGTHRLEPCCGYGRSHGVRFTVLRRTGGSDRLAAKRRRRQRGPFVRRSRLFSCLLSVLATAALLLSLIPVVPAAATPPLHRSALLRPLSLSASVTRVAGRTRYETAVAVAKQEFSHADTVVLATGHNFPDALAGAPLAYAYHAPLLLTDTNALPAVVRAEIASLGAKHAIILGGASVVGDGVVAGLRSLGIGGTAVTRLQGPDRFGTASAIALALRAKIGPTPRVMVATGLNFPDAVAAAGFAARAGMPILLVRPTDLPAATRAALASLSASTTIVLGSSKAVSEGVANAFPAPLRIYGSDRFSTAAAIAEYAYSTGFSYSSLFVATGLNFPDALAAGPWAASALGPMVLVAPTSVPQSTAAFVVKHGSSIKSLVVVGDTPAVGSSVAAALLEAGKTVIAAGTVIESTATAAALSTTTANTLVFTHDTTQLDGLVAGDTIVGIASPGAPAGFLRRFVSVRSQPDGSVVVSTTDASLSDVITKGSLDAAVPLQSSNSAAAIRSRDPLATFTSSVSIDETLDGVVHAKAKLTFSGTYTFNASFDYGGVRSVEAKVRLEDNLSTELSAVAAVQKEWKKNLGPRIPLGQTVVWAGPVPVYIDGGAQPVFDASGSFQTGVKSTAALDAWAEAGARYDGSWHPEGNAGVSASYSPPQVFSSGEVRASIGVDVDCQIDDVIGPYCGADLFGKLSYDSTIVPRWKLSAGVDAVAGGKVQVFGWTLVSFEKSWTLVEKEIAWDESQGATGRIAFTREGGIWTILPDGSSQQLLTQVVDPSVGWDVGSLRWEPASDSKNVRLWYTVWQDEPPYRGLYSVDMHGNVRRWNTGSVTVDSITCVAGGTTVDGRTYPMLVNSQDGFVFGVNTAANRLDRLFSIVQPSSHPPRELSYFGLNLSPDKSLLLFNQTAGMGFADFIANSDGSGQRRFVTTWIDDGFPGFAWAPDSQHFIGWTWNKGNGDHIVEFDRAGDVTRTLYQDGQGDTLTSADYGPDGSTIAFTLAHDDGSSDLWAMDSSGNNLHKLCDDAGEVVWR